MIIKVEKYVCINTYHYIDLYVDMDFIINSNTVVDVLFIGEKLHYIEYLDYHFKPKNCDLNTYFCSVEELRLLKLNEIFEEE